VELYQAEWCPYSHMVRQRLTELGLDYAVRQVEADPDERHELYRATGTYDIPALVTDRRDVVCGAEDILAYLNRYFDETRDAGAHREKALQEVPDFPEAQGRVRA
jgi:glutathione S-transferase